MTTYASYPNPAAEGLAQCRWCGQWTDDMAAHLSVDGECPVATAQWGPDPAEDTGLHTAQGRCVWCRQPVKRGTSLCERHLAERLANHPESAARWANVDPTATRRKPGRRYGGNVLRKIDARTGGPERHASG